MTTFPKHPAMKAAATVAQHGRDVTRAHARLDQVESTNSQQASQITTANTNIATNTTAITTANTNIATNTTAITAVNTGSGGSAQENFLGSLTQLANFGLNATGGWTTGGALQAGSWDSTHATALVGFMNAVYADLQDLLQAFRDSNIIS